MLFDLRLTSAEKFLSTLMTKAAATALNILLAEEVEKYPILWDITSELYRRSDLMPGVWQEVADNINNQQGSSLFSAVTAKKKFKDLKENFFKNERKVRESYLKCSGKGADEMYRPSWPVYKYLLYLKKSCAQVPSVSNIPKPSPAVAEVFFQDAQIEFIDETSSDLIEMSSPPCASPRPSSAASMTSIASVSSIPPSSTFEESEPSTSTSFKRPASNESFFVMKGKKTNLQPFLDKAVSVLEKFSQQPAPSAASAQPLTSPFALYITQHLNDMVPSVRKACEYEIIDVIRKYDP